MVTADELIERASLIEASPDLTALLHRLAARAQPVIQRMPPLPRFKALLSSDGGVCPRDGTALVFDPWSPDAHRCPRCGQIVRGERHDRNWAKFQHLWLAERAVHLATVGVFTDDAAAGSRASEILAAYGDLYFELPNRDNVLGPTHLFFSTYLESIWVLNYVAAATLLRETGRLDADLNGAIDRVIDAAANVIGEFNEGFSNRQTWHAAALTAIGAWFGDDDLARTAIESRTGLLGHLADGFGDDGTWYEGENYHLFALRGLLQGLGWARRAGADLLEDPEVAAHLKSALLAPARTALPDLTFPARKDSRFGVSLGQPMYLELWEIGRSMVDGKDEDLAGWLTALYDAPAQPAIAFESYLHEAGEIAPARRYRSDLSWWALLTMEPELPPGAPWTPESRYLPSQGLAILRRGSRYASLECGGHGGGHGHPDRLHLTLHANGVHWLPDFGTGSYVSRDLFWYRSTMAHNAPLINGISQAPTDATCEMFDARGDWGWTRGRFGDCERTIVAGPEYVLDVLTLSASDEREILLPWHLSGELTVETPGRWETVASPVDPASAAFEFVHDPERFIPDSPGALRVVAEGDGVSCRLMLVFEGELLRARAPGAPGSGDRTFLLARGRGRLVRIAAVLDLAGAVRDVTVTGDTIEVTQSATDRHVALLEGWEIQSQGTAIRLAGPQRVEVRGEPLLAFDRVERPRGSAIWVDAPPALDGTPTGFDLSEPLAMDTELHYRRSEEPYDETGSFGATAWINWSDDELYLLVEVTKLDVCFRPANAPPLGLDNEPDDIHSDGVEFFLAREDVVLGFLIVPDSASGGLRVSMADGAGGDASMIRGAWAKTSEGYRVTIAARPGWIPDPKERLEFDILVNEMRSDRQRRAGQLVWSGANGWVYLRGNRQDRRSLGILELA